jgi:DNA topoisomerase-1
VERDEGRFKPTGLGMAVNEFLVVNFSREVDLPFTAGMEEELDKVALGRVDWRKMIANFWEKFEKEVALASDQAERVKVEAEKTGEKCPECKEGDLVVRLGRFGKFISCARFPECKYKGKLLEKAGFACPLCGGEGVVKKTRTGRKFYGCTNYPKCKWAGWKRP